MAKGQENPQSTRHMHEKLMDSFAKSVQPYITMNAGNLAK